MGKSESAAAAATDVSVTCKQCDDAPYLPSCLCHLCFACHSKGTEGGQKLECPSEKCRQVVGMAARLSPGEDVEPNLAVDGAHGPVGSPVKGAGAAVNDVPNGYPERPQTPSRSSLASTSSSSTTSSPLRKAVFDRQRHLSSGSAPWDEGAVGGAGAANGFRPLNGNGAHPAPTAAAASSPRWNGGAPSWPSGASVTASAEDVRRETLAQAEAEHERLGRTFDEAKIRLNMQYMDTESDVRRIGSEFKALVESSERKLLQRLEKIRVEQTKILVEDQRRISIRLTQIKQELSVDVNGVGENAREKYRNTSREIAALRGSYSAQEDDVVHFTPPNMELVRKLASDLGHVFGSACATHSIAKGTGIKKFFLGENARFEVMVRDQLNEQCKARVDSLKVAVSGPGNANVRSAPIINLLPAGTYSVSWRADVAGEHTVAVTVKNRHIVGSPFRVAVETPKLVIGSEGSDDGQLCRPWGVCCDTKGNILVANRSNHRIEIFTSEGTFLRRFGSEGNECGQFNRPSSVCCDRSDRIVVSDKDNHRVQIFSAEGDFLLTFGEQGARDGQFNYPWDVACNSKDDILVSDSKNCRIQLFDSSGNYLNKFDIVGKMCRTVAFPRGVCFTSDDKMVVTDFNNHRLLLIDSDFQNPVTLGSEGDGMFVRADGVAVDGDGRFIVTDSRSHRVQIFSSTGLFVCGFGGEGSGPAQFCKPSGVAVSPDGSVIIVDMGNHRVQVF